MQTFEEALNNKEVEAKLLETVKRAFAAARWFDKEVGPAAFANLQSGESAFYSFLFNSIEKNFDCPTQADVTNALE